MNNIILVGAGGHAKSCIDVIEKNKRFKIVGLIDKNKKLLKKNILGYPIIGQDKDLKKFSKKYKYAFICIGQIKNSKPRENYFSKLKFYGFKIPKIISPLAYVSEHSKIGEGTIIMHNAFVNSSTNIGFNCIINSKAHIEHDVSIGDHTHISTGAFVNGGVKIGSSVFLGSKSVIKNSIIIENKVVVGMGKHVKKNLKKL